VLGPGVMRGWLSNHGASSASNLISAGPSRVPFSSMSRPCFRAGCAGICWPLCRRIP